jgi:hypothetical protein
VHKRFFSHSGPVAVFWRIEFGGITGWFPVAKRLPRYGSRYA